ncbi:hypothetical protein [Flavobacterium sp.]|uniref:hypothetical protein n=1 Tax=Flavobacterium sp. TaxID=239 RepID=UPI00120C4EA9|nr:hypothetical protein [Flavobacterium sp.]RZJ69074.1 MAG: hypothetical protein EOO49_18690 [Flavobacterium sp.]
MRNSVLALLACFAICACSRKQEVSPKVLELVKPLETHTFVQVLDSFSESIGVQLKQTASEEELDFFFYNGKSPYERFSRPKF